MLPTDIILIDDNVLILLIQLTLECRKPSSHRAIAYFMKTLRRELLRHVQYLTDIGIWQNILVLLLGCEIFYEWVMEINTLVIVHISYYSALGQWISIEITNIESLILLLKP
jgi:hypothetical protein